MIIAEKLASGTLRGNCVILACKTPGLSFTFGLSDKTSVCLTFRLKSALKVTPSLKNRYEIIIKSCSAKMNGSLIQTSYLTLKLGVFHQSFIRNIGLILFCETKRNETNR